MEFCYLSVIFTFAAAETNVPVRWLSTELPMFSDFRIYYTAFTLVCWLLTLLRGWFYKTLLATSHYLQMLLWHSDMDLNQ